MKIPPGSTPVHPFTDTSSASTKRSPGHRAKGLRPLLERPAISFSLRQELFVLIFALLFTISGIICFSAYMIFRTTILVEIGRARIDILKQIGERTRLIKSSLTTISNLYYHDEEIETLSGEDIFEVSGYDRLVRSLDEKARRYRVAFDELALDFYVVIVANNGFSYSSYRNGSYNFREAIQTLWFGEVVAEKGDICWVGSIRDFRETPFEQYVVSAARTLPAASTGARGGLLLVNMRERILYDTYRNSLTNRNTIYITDEKGTIVSHANERMLGLNYLNMSRLGSIFGTEDYALIRKGGDTILFSHYKDPASLWTIFEEIPIREILDPLRRVSVALLVIFAVCMFLSSLVSFLVSRRVTGPLNDFCLSIQKVGDGDLNVISSIRGWRELQDINSAFNQMIQEIKRLLEEVKEEERGKRKAELDFLRAQINPHFLYNTLFSVKCLVSMQKDREAGEMLSAFIDLIRMTFRGKEELVTLEEEIELLRRYVQIQQYRYGNSFEVSCTCGPEVQGCVVPRLILQPLVENAIFHGLNPETQRGRVSVEAKRVDDELIIRVKDNGVGMNAERIAAVLSGDSTETSGSDMVGIGNVHRRINLHFGTRYGLEIASVPGEGTTVLLRLPAIT